MNQTIGVTLSSDPSRDMPEALTSRLDDIRRALDSLNDEERRLSRLNFETPLARCHQARRFWNFVDGLHQVAALESERSPWSRESR